MQVAPFGLQWPWRAPPLLLPSATHAAFERGWFYSMLAILHSGRPTTLASPIPWSDHSDLVFPFTQSSLKAFLLGLKPCGILAGLRANLHAAHVLTSSVCKPRSRQTIPSSVSDSRCTWMLWITLAMAPWCLWCWTWENVLPGGSFNEFSLFPCSQIYVFYKMAAVMGGLALSRTFVFFSDLKQRFVS